MSLHALEFWLNILLSVVLISIFICVFFFTYASKVEKEIIINQTQELVRDMSTEIIQIPGVKETVKPYIEAWQPPDSSSADVRVDDANNKLLNHALSLIVTFATTVLVVVVILAYLYKISFVRLFVPNLIILILVGFTEFLFLRCIASNYVSFDPNFAEYQIIQTLCNYSDTEKNDAITTL